MTRISIALAIAAATLLAAPAYTQHAPPAEDKTVNLQGSPGAFGVEERMTPFYQVLLETHKQGDKADLAVMEGRIRALLPILSGGQAPSKEMEDHVMGVAHQALAMGVSNPKMFESYKTFMAAMMGPQ